MKTSRDKRLNLKRKSKHYKKKYSIDITLTMDIVGE